MNYIGSVSHKSEDLIAIGAFLLSNKNKDAVQHSKDTAFNSADEIEELEPFYTSGEVSRRKSVNSNLRLFKKILLFWRQSK